MTTISEYIKQVRNEWMTYVIAIGLTFFVLSFFVDFTIARVAAALVGYFGADFILWKVKK